MLLNCRQGAQRNRTAVAASIVLAVLMVPATAGETRSRDAVISDGRQEFEENCTGCHAKDGTGTGELGTKLMKPPKDLTLIAKANDGVFPFSRVFDIISGDKPVPGHDTFQMPIYSQRMRGQEGTSPLFLPAHVRVLELTHYVESIQKK